jgi:hypothetical protein
MYLKPENVAIKFLYIAPLLMSAITLISVAGVAVATAASDALG